MKNAPHDLTPDFASQQFQHDLYQHYGSYLKSSPVFRSDEGVVYLARYADCVELLGNDNFRRTPPAGGCNPFSEKQREQSPLEVMIGHWMVYMDPPRHDVVRKAFTPFFTAKPLRQLEPIIRRIAAQLVEALPQDGSAEFLQSYAFPLPVMVIADILGVPQQDREQFRIWSLQLTRALDAGNEDDLLRAAAASLALKDYFSAMLRERHSLPAHSLLRTLTTGGDAELTEDELLYGCAFLLWAGHETTKNLIANGILILAERPVDLARLQQQPALMDGAVEEMLRFESPVQKISRWAHADFTFGDYFVKQGTLLTALIGAANRDPAMFNQPDEFDLQRSRNRHIAFGSGIHHCLGAALARFETRIALDALLPRLRRLELLGHEWRTYSAFRSLESLHLKIQFAC